MRFVYLLLLILFPLLADCRISNPADTGKILSSIRRDYKNCNDSLSFFTKKELTFFEESTEGSLLEAYYFKSELRKIVVTTRGETGKAVCEYYLDNSRLIFSFYYLDQYDRPFYKKNQKRVKKTENRFYFNDEKLLRWIDDKGKRRGITTTDFQTQEKSVLDDFKEYKEKLTK